MTWDPRENIVVLLGHYLAYASVSSASEGSCEILTTSEQIKHVLLLKSSLGPEWLFQRPVFLRK